MQGSDEWEHGLLEEAIRAGAEILLDKYVVHDMEFPSLLAYWQV